MAESDTDVRRSVLRDHIAKMDEVWQAIMRGWEKRQVDKSTHNRYVEMGETLLDFVKLAYGEDMAKEVRGKGEEAVNSKRGRIDAGLARKYNVSVSKVDWEFDRVVRVVTMRGKVSELL